MKNASDTLLSRRLNESFSSTSALVYAAEPIESWNYALFRKCRTFDEVKLLARAEGFEASNEFGCIQLSREGQLVASFWLFD
jgi:hypothetical protein